MNLKPKSAQKDNENENETSNRQDNPASKRKAMETISKVRRNGKTNGHIARSTGSAEAQAGFCASRNVADGFLRHTFAPLFEQGANLPKREIAESGFFKSLSLLCKAHGYPMPDVSDKPYPYNILLAHAVIQDMLRQKGQEAGLSIVREGKDKISLETKNRFETGTTLYYIPVTPLYRLLQDKKQKATTDLLLSVFAYLYHVAGVPYYRDQYTALYYYYDWMEEWVNEELYDFEESYRGKLQREYYSALYKGDVMLRKIFNPCHLNNFQQRLERYTPVTPFEYGCLHVAGKAYSMLETYPDCTIFRNTKNEQLDEEDMIIRAEQYISFVADTQGVLYDNIAQMINEELGQCGEMEQPTTRQIFNAEAEVQTLDFEYEFFPLILNLCTLLYELP